MFDIRAFLTETYLEFDDTDMIQRIRDVADSELRARFYAAISTMENTRPGAKPIAVVIEMIEKRYDSVNPMTLKEIGETLSSGQRSQENIRQTINKYKRKFRGTNAKNFMVSGATHHFQKLKQVYAH